MTRRAELEALAARWFNGADVSSLSDRDLVTYLENHIDTHLEYWRGDAQAHADVARVRALR